MTSFIVMINLSHLFLLGWHCKEPFCVINTKSSLLVWQLKRPFCVINTKSSLLVWQLKRPFCVINTKLSLLVWQLKRPFCVINIVVVCWLCGQTEHEDPEDSDNNLWFCLGFWPSNKICYISPWRFKMTYV